VVISQLFRPHSITKYGWCRGNVTLELIDVLYTAPTDSFGFKLVGPIPGAGPDSRVTIKPAENKNVTIEEVDKPFFILKCKVCYD